MCKSKLVSMIKCKKIIERKREDKGNNTLYYMRKKHLKF